MGEEGARFEGGSWMGMVAGVGGWDWEGRGVDMADSRRLEGIKVEEFRVIEGVRLDGRIGGVIEFDVIAGVAVDVSWVPRSNRQHPDPVMGVSDSSPALDTTVGGRPFVTSFRIGRRDRGSCVVGAGHNRGRDVAGVGAS
jgi:hypothetical protein